MISICPKSGLHLLCTQDVYLSKEWITLTLHTRCFGFDSRVKKKTKVLWLVFTEPAQPRDS